MPTLTGYADMSPCPRVTVLFEAADLNPATATATVYQLSDTGQIPVREAERTFAVGGLVVTDYEPPLGVPVTYRAQQFDDAGAPLGYTDSATIQVDGADGYAYVQDPLDPASAVRVRVSSTFAEEVSESREVQLHRIGDETVALMGALGLIENVNLATVTETAADAVAYRAVLRRTQVLFRTMPPIPVPRCLNVVVPSVPARGWDLTGGGTFYTWALAGNEVSRSTLNIAVPVLTWQPYINAFPIWADFNADMARRRL